MVTNPLISVVMPVYNAQASVAAAVMSILQGTLDRLEMIVVDDGSTDDSAAAVANVAAEDRRVRLERLPHGGIVAALNHGVACARGPWIARMDADDRALPDRLRLQYETLAAGAADIVGSRVRIVDEAGEPVASMQRYQAWINDHLTHDEIAALRFVESPLVHPSVTARREVFELGYRDGPFPEDYDLWLRAMEAGCRVVKGPEVLLDWVERQGRLTCTGGRYSFEAFDRCRRMHLRAGPLCGVERVDVWGAGKTGKPWLRWLQGEGLAVRRLYEIRPRKVGQRIHGVVVEHPDAMGPADGTPLVIAVGAAGARELIGPHIAQRGYGPGKDTWFVA